LTPQGFISFSLFRISERAETELGEAFDFSTGYDFSTVGGGMPSPDSSWIEKSRLEGVSFEKFFSIAPDFVIELRSTSDDLKPTRKKMLVFLIIYYLYRNTLANS
jgi:Uma2 family endonuclease